MYYKKYRPLNDVKRWRSCLGVPRGCVNRIRLWPPRRDDHSGVLIGAGGTRRSDWGARVQANDLSTIIDRWLACAKLGCKRPWRPHSRIQCVFRTILCLVLRRHSPCTG